MKIITACAMALMILEGVPYDFLECCLDFIFYAGHRDGWLHPAVPGGADYGCLLVSSV